MIKEYINQKEVQLIIFRLGAEEYTVPIESVQEIIMPMNTTHIPNTPAFLEGVINLRDHIIPVIDGRKRFDLPVNNNLTDTRIIVLDLENHTVGLVVDAVSEVIHMNTDSIEPPPVDIGEDNDFLQGVGKHEDRLLILINPQKFLSCSETHNLSKISYN